MKSYYLFSKDYHSEIRTRYAINSLIMFIIVAVSVILFSIGNERVPGNLTAGLYWVVIFFSAMSGLGRAFISEEERGTSMTLQLIASPSTVLSGKIIFNMILVFAMNVVITLIYSILFEEFVIQNHILFIINFIFGNIGLAVSATIISAIIAKAGSKGTLYPVLSFPILLPLILTSAKLTLYSIDGTPMNDAVFELAIVACYDIIMVSASYMLFDFIWKD